MSSRYNTGYKSRRIQYRIHEQQVQYRIQEQQDTTQDTRAAGYNTGYMSSKYNT